MEEIKNQNEMVEINRKLDIILEEIESQKRHRREMDELKEDLMRIGKDLYQTAVDELEEVHDHLQTGDILHLGKKLLRNVKTINNMFEQMESIRDFLQDFGPISRELAIDFMDRMNKLDKKGYFEFLKESLHTVDNVVDSFSVDDVKALSENIVTILNTIKNLTQPEMLHAINNAVNIYKHMDLEVTGKVSAFELLRELNTPEAKRGIAFAIRFLKNLSNEMDNKIITIKSVQTN